MGKPAGGGGGGVVKGTSLNDTFHLTSASQLSTTYDGGAGTDTLDLSSFTTGVSIVLDNSFHGKSDVWPTQPFTGFYTDFTNVLRSTSSAHLVNTLQNIENVTGGSGNDYITAPGVANGGPGNDYVVGDHLIGGTGSDYLSSLRDQSTATLVGGTLVNGVATPDGQHDTFEVDGNGVILDFELGIDSLVLPEPAGGLAAFEAATWTNTTYNGVASAQLQLDGYTVTLAGITAAQAATIPVGLFFPNDKTTFTSGPGDDIIWPEGGTATNLLVFGPGSGNDTVTHFNISNDTLEFTSGAPTSWTQVSVNGETALQGVYDDGHSSVTLLGLTAADASHLLIALG